MKKIFRNSLFYGFSELIKNAFGFLLIPLYTRVLRVSDYGIVSTLSVAFLLIATFLRMGQEHACMRYFFDYKDESEKKSYLSTIFFFTSTVCFVFALLFTCFGRGLFELLFRDIPFYPYGIVLSWSIFFSVFEIIPLVVLRAKEKALKFSILNIALFLMRVTFVVFMVAYLKKGALGKIKADLLYFIIAGLLIFIPMMKPYIVKAFSVQKLSLSLKYGLPMTLHSTALWILNLSDRILIQHFMVLGSVAVYAVGYTMGETINVISSSIGKAWTPHFYLMAESEGSKREFAKITTYYVLITVLLALGICVFAKEIILILATHKYIEAVPIIPIVALSYLFHAFYKINTRILSYVKRTGLISLSTCTAAAVNIALNIIMIPKMGIIGAGLATVISFFILFVMSFVLARKNFRIDFETERIVKIVIAALLAYLFSLFLTVDNMFTGVLLKAVMLLLFPAILLGIGFCTKQERQVLSRILFKKA